VKDAPKQDTPVDDKDETAAMEMKCDTDNKEGVTKMDTIPAPVAVTTSEPPAEH